MAAPTIRQIRAGLAARLDTISGLRTFSFVPGQFSPPAGIVGMPERPKTETFQRGTDTYEVSVWIVVSRQSDRSAEKNLEPFLDATGTSSVRTAMLGDTTLGGTVNDLFEMSAEPVDFRFGTGDQEQVYIGLEFRYRIVAAGKD